MKREDLLKEIDGLRRRVAVLEDLQVRFKKTEQELRESEEAFRSLFENSADAILLTDPDGTVIKANPAACRTLQRTEQEICKIGRDGVVDLADPGLQPALEERARTGFFRGELNLKRKDGTIFPAEVSSSFFKSRAGDLRTCVIFRDLSEHKKAEAALKESVALLEEAQRVARIGNWSHDLQKNKVTWSDELYRIFGIEKPEFGGKYESFVGLIHPDDRQLVLQTNARARNEGTSFDFEYRIILSGGQVKTMREVGYADRSEDGRVIRLFGTAQDITDRKRMEQHLRNSEASLRDLYENAPNAYFSVGTDGVVKRCNKAAEALLGYPREVIEGKRVLDLYVDGPAGKEKAAKAFRKFVSGEPVTGEELQMQGADGSPVWVSLSVNALRDAAGRVLESRSVVVDINDRKKAEELVRQTTYELGVRVNELNCLLGISKVVDRPGVPMDEILQGIVDLIPSAWQYPEITYARMILEDQEFKTENFSDTSWKQSADIIVRGKPIGSLEVGYLEERLKSDEGIFRKDERSLIDAIAGRSGRIIERMRMETALRESEAKFRLLHETMRDAFVIVDMAGRIQDTNQAYQEMLGYSEEELRNLTYIDLTPEKWHALESSIVQEQILLKGHSEVYQKEYRKKDGTVFPIELRTFLIKDKTDQPALMWATVRDITQRKRLEAEKENLLKDLTEALAQVKKLSGFLPICASCKKIRDDQGYWQQIEEYIREHSEAEFSHSVCPDCAKKLYPEFFKNDSNR